MTTGTDYACGIKTDKRAWCWGTHTSGQLGNATTATTYTPTAVSGGGTWSLLAAGDPHTCGLKTDNTMWCGGSNAYGQLGGPQAATSATPVPVTTTQA